MTETSTKLLIVDDLPENLRALNALIRESDRSVYQASSGEEALALLLEHDFALAILDVQMPEMDGFELAQLMRGTEKTRHIPIVFVTAAGKEMNFAFQGYESGAVDFLHKPLDINAVQSKVNVFVALHQQRNETRRQVQALEYSRQQQEALLKELRATQAELQRSLRLRDEFMSMVAHELRTPLNTLFLETQMRTVNLERGNLAAFEADKLNKMVARDGRQIRSMVRLIDDMLDVSRITSGKLSIRREPVDLACLVRRVADDLAHYAATTGSVLEVLAFEPIHGYWDAFRVEQIVVNLISNALRYGQGQPVEISLAHTQNSAVIEVRDHGIGIGAKDQERIFDAFERVMYQDRSGGLGLGLFITKQLVDAHGGAITLQSQPGNGALFSVTLPLAGS
nr:hybrid sensor histidine kinase/response regulator [Janthinobacterium sp. 1_2014MBL_MicDiv]